MQQQLAVLFDDVLREAGALLEDHPSTAIDRKVGIEFSSPPCVGILIHPDGDVTAPPRYTWREPAGRAHAELCDAAQALTAAWVNALGQGAAVGVAYVIDQHGGSMRLYACPATGELAIAIKTIDGQITQLDRFPHEKALH